MSLLDQPSLRSQIHAALRAWDKVDGIDSDLMADLMLVQAERDRIARDGASAASRLALNHVLLSGLEGLSQKDELGARILRLRFLEKKLAVQVANELSRTIDSVNHLQRRAINNLTTIIWEQENALREIHAQRLEGRLPPPRYSQLFGLDNARQQLTKRLITGDDLFLLSIVGLGGIGKTALANQVARDTIRKFHFDQVLWVRVEPFSMSGSNISPAHAFEQVMTGLSQQLPGVRKDLPSQERLIQVRQWLKTKPHLVVIDNIEEKEDADYLFERLGNLADPSKFLVTTRARPVGQYAVSAFALGELGAEDALDLVRHEAKLIGLKEIASAENDHLMSIYTVVGGNPLALKLTVGLIQSMPLPAILTALQRGNVDSTENMFRHIFQSAWVSLSEHAQVLLESMPIIGETGARPEQMLAATELSDAQLWTSIEELVGHSLLEVRGTAWDRRYGIHQLTETFLQTDIIGW